MTQSEVILRLQNDALFALDFAINNNPTGLVTSLKSKGITMPSGVVDVNAWLKQVLTEMLNTSKQEAIDLITSVPYNKYATNYTAGYESFFMNTQPASTVTASQRFSLDSLLAGLGSGLSTYAAYSTGTAAGTGTAQDIAAQAAMQAEAKRLEDERKKRLNKIILWTVVGVVVLGVVIYFFTRKKKA